MRQIFNIFSFIFLFFLGVSALSAATIPNNLEQKKLKVLLNGDFIIDSKVSSSGNEQELHLVAEGLHEKSCNVALKKISRYEDFSKYINFVKNSSYDEKNRRIVLFLSGSIVPISLILDFVIDRVDKPGVYKFIFDRGMMVGLHGTIEVQDIFERCYFKTTSDWKGKKTPVSDIVLDLFLNTAARMSMDNLFRISKNY